LDKKSRADGYKNPPRLKVQAVVQWADI